MRLFKTLFIDVQHDNIKLKNKTLFEIAGFELRKYDMHWPQFDAPKYSLYTFHDIPPIKSCSLHACRCFTRIRGIIHREGEAALSDVYSWRRRELGHEFPMWTFIKTDRHIRTERSHLKNKRLSSRYDVISSPTAFHLLIICEIFHQRTLCTL